MPSLRVIIVNFNTGEALLACMEAALAYPEDLVVAVVDNASEDHSMELVQSRFGNDRRVELHSNPTNPGFARAVNQMARSATEDYLLVLNPDCVLQSGALAALVESLERHRSAAIAGPWVTDQRGRLQSGTWRRLPDPWHALMTVTGLHRFSRSSARFSGINDPRSEPPDEVTEVEAVSGACMLLRRSAVKAVDFFDEGYPMHCEDLDLMKRLRLQGSHCLLVPEARAVHLGGVSSDSRSWWVHRQKHLGMQRYFRKLLAADYAFPMRWLVYVGIWCHYLLTLPTVLFRHRGKAT